MHSSRKLILNRTPGFTLVELITIIVILGILATIAAPRFFDRDDFDSRSFYDQMIATLRSAQKIAIAQRRFVCIAFTSNSITLTYDTTAPSATHTVAACPGAGLTGPAGQSPYQVSSNNAQFSSLPSDFNFDALGRPSGPQTITVSGYGNITVEQETGYVY